MEARRVEPAGWSKAKIRWKRGCEMVRERKSGRAVSLRNPHLLTSSLSPSFQDILCCLLYSLGNLKGLVFDKKKSG